MLLALTQETTRIPKNGASGKTERINGWLSTVKHHFNFPFFQPDGTAERLDKAMAELYSQTRILSASALLSEADVHGRITYANEKFCEISGYSAEELIGKPHNIIRHPDTPSAVFKEMWDTIKSGRVWQGELKNKTKNGKAYWVIATIAPVMGKNGRPERYISVRYDITKQKQMEEELRIAKLRTETELVQNVNYARRIHNSMLTDAAGVRSVFPESFVVYKAQNMISGDFYKVERKGRKSVIAMGDSTGHGLSASYISIIILNHLSRMLESGASNPSLIMRLAHREVKRSVGKAKEEPVVETADMLTACLDHETKEFTYVSARASGVVIRNGEIIELQKDKCSIGDPEKEELALTVHKLQLQEGDQVFLFSDGMYDQLGGPLGKRFSRKKFIDLLSRLQHKTPHAQKEMIELCLEEWQGANQQTDDMTLLAFRI